MLERKGFRANCPKTHVQGCVDPKPQKKTQKRVNTKEEEGSFKRLSSNSRQRSRKNNPEKIAKTLRNAAARPFLATSPTRTQNATHPRQKISQIGPRPEKSEKRHFQNDLSSATPSRFLAFQTQFGQKFEPPKNKFVRPARIILKKVVQNQGSPTCPKRVEEAQQRQNRSETPFVEAFRSLLPLGVRRQEPRRQRRENKNDFAKPQKTRKRTSKMAFLEKAKNTKNHHLLRIIDLPRMRPPPFRTTKTVLSGRGGRKLTRRPRINS